jgi:hypothetical protein
MRKPVARRIRRSYANTQYPLVVLRFEDGHEIQVKNGEGKSFDAFAGEAVKVIAVWGSGAGEREVVADLKAEQFEEDR